MAAETSINTFERAVRLKLRFPTVRGGVSLEDLYDMPLTSRDGFNLDTVAKNLNRAVKNAEEESFVVKASRVSDELELGFGIVKHIIAVKMQEREDAETAAEKRERKQKILAVLAKKQDAALEGKTEAELVEELATL